MSIISSTIPGGGTDHHSGYYYIPAALTVTVAENKQMTTWGILDIDGALIIDGQLITEP
jgi:hypothetical protein